MRMILTPNLNDVYESHTKTIEQYGISLHTAARGLWAGRTTIEDFIEMMESSIRRGFGRAWNEGAKSCGILPGERTRAEQERLDQLIAQQNSFIFGFGEWIEANSKAEKKLLRNVLGRLQMWVNRYGETKAIAQQMACANFKQKWVWDPRKEHCIDCRKLNGRVYRGEVWRRYDIAPRSHKLACFGGNCGCSLILTDEPVTPGRPPSLIGRR